MTSSVDYRRSLRILLTGLLALVGVLLLPRYTDSSSRQIDGGLNQEAVVEKDNLPAQEGALEAVFPFPDELIVARPEQPGIDPHQLKRLPSGALDYPDPLKQIRSVVEVAKERNTGDDDDLVAILEFMEQDMIAIEKKRAETRATANADDADYYEAFDEISATRSELAQSIWQLGVDRRERMWEGISERRDDGEIQEWLSAIPAKISTPIEDQTYEALVSGKIDDYDDLPLIADYLRARRSEARRQLEELDPGNPHWWADHLDWVEGVAARLRIPLDAENGEWVQDFISYWEGVKARRVKSLTNGSPGD